jgi:hypothetical protein
MSNNKQVTKEQPEATPTEKRFLKALHWMHCPKCGHQLTTERRDPVEIEVCPGCGGIWLDATDLETILAAEPGFLRSCFQSLRPG